MAVVGDFNVVHLKEERTGSASCRKERWSFNSFINGNNLIEFDEGGPKFSYSNNHQQPSLTKLDCFLANSEWVKFFPGFVER